MDLARAWPGAERVRAPWKRLDRLLGNAFLQGECRALYGAMARWLMRQPRPIIIADGSELQPNGRWHLLRAGIPMGARTVRGLEAVHPERLKNSARAEGQLLVQLRTLLPAGVIPILVCDVQRSRTVVSRGPASRLGIRRARTSSHARAARAAWALGR